MGSNAPLDYLAGDFIVKRLGFVFLAGLVFGCGSDGTSTPNDATVGRNDAEPDAGTDANAIDEAGPTKLSLAVTVRLQVTPPPYVFGYVFPTSHSFSLTVDKDGKGIIGSQGFAVRVTMDKTGNVWRIKKPMSISAPHSSYYGCGDSPIIVYETLEIRAGSNCTGTVSGSAGAAREDTFTMAPFTGTLTCVPDERPRFWTPSANVAPSPLPPPIWTGLPLPPSAHYVNKPLIADAKASMVHVESGTVYPLIPIQNEGSVSTFHEPSILKRPGHYMIRAETIFVDFNGDSPVDSVLHQSESAGPAIPVLTDPGFDVPVASGLAINALFVDATSFTVIDGKRSLLLLPGYNNGGSAAFRIPLKVGVLNLRFKFRRVWDRNAIERTPTVAIGVLGTSPAFAELPVHTGEGEPVEYQIPSESAKRPLQIGPVLEAEIPLSMLGPSITDASEVYVFFVGRISPRCSGGVLFGFAPGILIDNLRVE